MQKILTRFILLLPLVGCHQTNPDYLTLEHVIEQYETEILGYGLQDTAFIRISARPEITVIANKPRDSVFWSPMVSDNIVKYARSGYCLINAKIDYRGACPYRIYCGTGEMLNAMMASDINYATEICR